MLKHIGLPVRTKNEIEQFYMGILGFEKVHEFSIPEEYSRKIFGIKKPAAICLLRKGDLMLEIFMDDHHSVNHSFHHLCLDVEKIDSIVKQLTMQEYPVTIIERDKGDLVFIADKSGNLFELKEA